MDLRSGRDAYWARNGFGADGGHSKRWIPFKVLGVPLYIYNGEARRRAAPIHDLHHVVTGYRTDLIGEAEIGAWELASGCRRMPFAAFFLDAGAAALGMFISPRRVLAAWRRGSACTNLYGIPCDDALLARRVDDVRRELGVDRGHQAGGARTSPGLM